MNNRDILNLKKKKFGKLRIKTIVSIATVFLLDWLNESQQPEQRSFLPLKRGDLIKKASRKAQEIKEVLIIWCLMRFLRFIRIKKTKNRIELTDWHDWTCWLSCVKTPKGILHKSYWKQSYFSWKVIKSCSIFMYSLFI